MKSYRITQPPRFVRRARLDNLALVPGNLLPFKNQWQAIANQLPKGEVLIVLPRKEGPSRKLLKDVATLLDQKGRRVTIVASTTVT